MTSCWYVLQVGLVYSVAGLEMTLEYQKESESRCSEQLMQYNQLLGHQLILRVSYWAWLQPQNRPQGSFWDRGWRLPWRESYRRRGPHGWSAQWWQPCQESSTCTQRRRTWCTAALSSWYQGPSRGCSWLRSWWVLVGVGTKDIQTVFLWHKRWTLFHH